MRTALFPHMEWAKAHSRHPLPVELGFSGAKAPSGRGYREHGSGEPELEGKIARLPLSKKTRFLCHSSRKKIRQRWAAFSEH